jgi:hypothetical protein
VVRIATLATIACAAATGCASARAPAHHPATTSPARHLATSLTISYSPHGTSSGVRRWHLTCGPAGGTHPRPHRACRELAADGAELAPVRHPCPLLLRRGAPEASVVGRDHGRRIDRLLRPACDVTAWRDLGVLLSGR